MIKNVILSTLAIAVLAGCEIIRCTVPTKEAALAIKEIKKQIEIPLVADIHFDYKMAIMAMENGADKIRINPGNIGGTDKIKAVVDVAKERNIPIRVGVNSGSLEKELIEKYGGVTAEGIVESALDKVKIIEDLGYDNLVVSIKSSDVLMCARAHELIAEKTQYPLHWELKQQKKIIREGSVVIPDGAFDLVELDEITFDFPEITEAATYHLDLSVPETNMANTYELYCFPTLSTEIPASGMTIGEGANEVHVTADYAEACALLQNGQKVLYLPTELADKIEGFYCTDFWCYPMFRDICEWMKKPVAVGTMGLLIQKDHPALASFPAHKYSTPQWYKIVSHCDCAILDDVTDKSYRPIVQMVDNFERNHKLRILFEGKVGEGTLMVCTSRLSEVAEYPEIKCFARSILDYVTSDAFAPEQTLDMALLKRVFCKED